MTWILDGVMNGEEMMDFNLLDFGDEINSKLVVKLKMF